MSTKSILTAAARQHFTGPPPAPRRRRQLVTARRLTHRLVIALLVIGGQAPLDSVRWWRSPRVTSALGLTAEQSLAIDHIYQQTLPLRTLTSIEIIELTGRISQRIRDGIFDDDSLRLSERLMTARLTDTSFGG